MTSELDRLERQAQEVRGQLALDLDELFLRLQPRRMVRSIAAHAQDTQAGSGLGHEIVRDMRHNPIPYLLMGMGIAGLAWTMTSLSRSRTRARLPEFSDADFEPPPSPRVAAAVVRATPVTSTSTSTTPAASPASTAPAREISPVTSEMQ
jgi:hypothetical protein